MQNRKQSKYTHRIPMTLKRAGRDNSLDFPIVGDHVFITSMIGIVKYVYVTYRIFTRKIILVLYRKIHANFTHLRVLSSKLTEYHHSLHIIPQCFTNILRKGTQRMLCFSIGGDIPRDSPYSSAIGRMDFLLRRHSRLRYLYFYSTLL